jgi:ribose/xylose/arabinose/galactoside ABC-type transport system permease subunit
VSIRDRLARTAAVEGAAVTVAFIVMVVVFAVSSPFFLTGQNLHNLFVESVFTVLLAAGMTYVIIVGGIDLSVGSVLGLSAGMTLMTASKGAPLLVAILVGVATGMVVGLVNGLLIAHLGVNAFIVTLATLSIGGGALNVLTTRVELTGVDSTAFTNLSQGSVLGIPAPVLMTLAVVLLLEFVLIATPFGRRIFAAGINDSAAHLAGVNLRRLRLQVYVLSGVVAGFAGVLLAAHLNSVQPDLGTGFELTAIAAAVIGGVSLSGGQGSVWRAVVGAFFLTTLSQGLQLLGVDPTWFTIVTGVSIVAAIAFSRGTQWFASSLRPAAPRPSAPAAEAAEPTHAVDR